MVLHLMALPFLRLFPFQSVCLRRRLYHANARLFFFLTLSRWCDFLLLCVDVFVYFAPLLLSLLFTALFFAAFFWRFAAVCAISAPVSFVTFFFLCFAFGFLCSVFISLPL